jgi:hypothetical protein
MIDGIDCINIYSKAKTQLGIWLSNFSPIAITGGGHTFASVEAWWYWFETGKKHEGLKILSGFAAKKEGRKFEKVQRVTPGLFKKIALLKLEQHQALKEALKASTLPLVHFYEYNGKTVWPKDFTAQVCTEIRAKLKNPGCSDIGLV